MKKMFALLILLTSCSGNLFQELSSKTGDDDYILEAQEYLNNEDYDSAITVLTTKLSIAGQQTVKAREVLASSYAGKCGLNFIEYTDSLAASTTGSAFSVLMAPFVGKAVAPQYCRNALDTMQLIGTTSTRTLNQNAFTSIVGMVLIGTALRGYADIAPALGDGTADVNICSVVTDDEINDVVLGFGFMSENFGAVSSTLIGGSSSSSLDAVINTCTSVAGASCQITDSANITPAIRDTVRDLVNTSEYGIGAFSTGGNDLLIPVACP
jgi:hypothetical protein